MIVGGCKKCGAILDKEIISDPVGGFEYEAFSCPNCGPVEIDEVQFNDLEYFTNEEEE